MADGPAWPSSGRDYTNRRWSPLTQITTANVAALVPAWIFHSGIAHSSESSPVVVDGVMYLSTALNHVVALDAATGARKWAGTGHEAGSLQPRLGRPNAEHTAMSRFAAASA